MLHGAMNCGKAQPGQIAAVSHGCPSALFRGVNVLKPAEASAEMRAQEMVERTLAAPAGAGCALIVARPAGPRCAGPTRR